MASAQFHRLHADEFAEASLEARGALSGWMGGRGHGAQVPHLTPELIEGYEQADAVLFNAGYKAALRQHNIPAPVNGADVAELIELVVTYGAARTESFAAGDYGGKEDIDKADADAAAAIGKIRAMLLRFGLA